MASLLAFDEINRLDGYKPRAMPFEDYFGPMEISASAKARRISFAEGLMDKMAMIFALCEIYDNYDMFTQKWLEGEILNTYITYLSTFVAVDEYLARHASKFAELIAANTSEHIRPSTPEDKWYFSMDRAELIGENEAGVIVNYFEFTEAVEEGYTHKTWCTVGDNRVRDTHESTDGQTVEIDDYFEVGDEYGMFPGDTEHLSAGNTVNCRCWLEYS